MNMFNCIFIILCSVLVQIDSNLSLRCLRSANEWSGKFEAEGNTTLASVGRCFGFYSNVVIENIYIYTVYVYIPYSYLDNY